MPSLLPRVARIFLALHGRFEARVHHMAAVGTCRMGPGVRMLGRARVVNGAGTPDAIRIGDSTVILGALCTFSRDAWIRIGRDSYIGPDSNVVAMEAIEIGDRVQIAHGVNIYDNNSHSTSASIRFDHMRAILSHGHPPDPPDVETAPVSIGNDAWIGLGATILKGVHIGRGAIVGAGAVVAKDVPDFAIVAGNPQRIVGEARP